MRIKKFSFGSRTMLFKLFVMIGLLILCVTGLDIFFLHWMAQETVSQRDQAMTSIALGIATIHLLLGLVIYVMIWKIYRVAIIEPMTTLSEIIHGVQMQNLDITSDLSDTQCKEVQIIAQAANNALMQIASLISRLNDAEQKILDLTKQIFSAAQNQSVLLTSEGQTMSEAVGTIRELTITSRHMGDDVNAVVEIANKTLQYAEQGSRSVMNVVKSMEAIHHSSQISSEKIVALAKQSEHINDVVTTIDRIIEDTKLIAFNATIEAARAKDEGKGFGVVAIEVKRLAEEVFESTEDMKEFIQDIRTASHALVLTAEDVMKAVHHGSHLAHEAGTSLTQIVEMVKSTTDSAQRIASAAQQQQTSSEQVLQAVNLATQSLRQFSEESSQITAAAAELTLLAEGFGRILVKFQEQDDGGRTTYS